MKFKKYFLFITLVLSLINISCSSGDKYLGTWENINNGKQMTISKHKLGTLFSDIGTPVDYDINYSGQIFYCGINGKGELGILR